MCAMNIDTAFVVFLFVFTFQLSDVCPPTHLCAPHIFSVFVYQCNSCMSLCSVCPSVFAVV